ncbi:MAG: photosynthetic complex putative assembly protein PuhB [Pseudomonadota bacterium]
MSMPKAPLTQDFPAALPTGERALWRGGPGIAGLARHALHLRKLAVYFALLAVWRLIAVWRDGFSIDAATNALVTTGLLAFAVIAALALYARYSARSTSYSITTERVVIRTGIALPITVNLPFSKIASVDVRRRANGSGDIELTLNEGERASYVILWPSAKPFRFLRVRPMLRALDNVDPIADLLSDALRSHVVTHAPEQQQLQGHDEMLPA